MLQRSLELQYANPLAHYLLGAQFAQRERYGDAVLHFSTAVEQQPHLAAARLQLGLLWLTLKNPGSAVAQLRPLIDLSQSDAMHHFGRGLIALAGDDLPAAHAALSQGLAIGSDNAALVGDMRKLLKGIENAQRNPATVPAPGASNSLASLQHGLAISAYQGVDRIG